MTLKEYAGETKPNETFTKMLKTDLEEYDKEARYLYDIGVELKVLLPFYEKGMVPRLAKYPKLLDKLDDKEFKARMMSHEEKWLGHELYMDLLWLYGNPEAPLKYIDEGVPKEFLKEHSRLPDMVSYILECKERGLPYDSGKHYETIDREDNRGVGIPYWAMVFELERLGYLGNSKLPKNTREIYTKYLNTRYDAELDEILPIATLRIKEALLSRGITDYPFKDRIDHENLEHIINVIASEPNICEYIALVSGTECVEELLMELPKREIPYLLGNVVKN